METANRSVEQATGVPKTGVRDLAPTHRRLLLAAARRFYLEDRSKVEIAEELGISRFKVARLLEQARETGVVTITLND